MSITVRIDEIDVSPRSAVLVWSLHSSSGMEKRPLVVEDVNEAGSDRRKLVRAHTADSINGRASVIRCCDPVLSNLHRLMQRAGFQVLPLL